VADGVIDPVGSGRYRFHGLAGLRENQRYRGVAGGLARAQQARRIAGRFAGPGAGLDAGGDAGPVAGHLNGDVLVLDAGPGAGPDVLVDLAGPAAYQHDACTSTTSDKTESVVVGEGSLRSPSPTTATTPPTRPPAPAREGSAVRPLPRAVAPPPVSRPVPVPPTASGGASLPNFGV